MGLSLGLVMMLAWAAISAGLFRVLGPRRGTLVAVIGGNLLVPCVVLDLLPESRLQLTQPVAIGLAVVLGVSRRPRSLSRIRPEWFDLPMLAYVAYPLTGLLVNGRVAAWDAADMLMQRGLGVLVPYAAARRYLGDPEGARHRRHRHRGRDALLRAGGRLRGRRRADRLSGHAPLRCQSAGLPGRSARRLEARRVVPERSDSRRVDGAGGGRRVRALAGSIVAAEAERGPAWWPALVLALAAAGCRSIYGDITLGVGLSAALATRVLRTRGVIALLLLAAPVYVGLRIGGLWDAQVLTRLAGTAGRASTVAFRLSAEDTILRRVLALTRSSASASRSGTARPSPRSIELLARRPVADHSLVGGPGGARALIWRHSS